MGTRSFEKMHSLYSITYYWNWSILAPYSLPTNTFPSTWMEVHHICKESSRCGKIKIIVNIACVKHLTTSMSVSMKRSVIQSLSLSLTILTISQQNDRKENLKAIRILKNIVSEERRKSLCQWVRSIWLQIRRKTFKVQCLSSKNSTIL